MNIGSDCREGDPLEAKLLGINKYKHEQKVIIETYKGFDNTIHHTCYITWRQQKTHTITDE